MTELDARQKIHLVSRRSLSGNPDALKVLDLAVAALAEQDAEIARLHAELATQQDRAMIHATGTHCEQIIASGVADDEAIGTLLCSTDDMRTWERTAAGWEIR